MTDVPAPTDPTTPAESPDGVLLASFSSPGAPRVPWSAVREALERAEVSWVSTVRPDGRPHVTPLLTVTADGSLFFCTGKDERKARNLESSTHVVLTTGANRLDEGMDVVVEGDAERVTDDVLLHRLAERWRCTYDWHFTVRDGSFWDSAGGDGGGGEAYVFAVRPEVVFAYARGPEHTAMRWRFGPGSAPSGLGAPRAPQPAP